MKKKILLVLLVVLMVGILAFSVFACNKNKGKDPVKPNTPVTPDEPGIDDTDYLGEALGAVVTAIDNTLANVNDIESAASVSADIVVKVAVGTETYDVSLKIKGSIDSNEGAAAKNWAQIDADVLGVKVSLFAMNDGSKETLYIAQNVLQKGENVQWNKLSQFEEANVLSDLACGSILDLVKGIDDKTAASLESGFINGFAGEILSMVGIVGALFQPAEGAGKDFATESGYGIGLNIAELGQLLPTLLKTIGGVNLGDAAGLVNAIGGIVLGGTLDLGAGSFEPGEHVPTVEIGVGIENELFTGLSLKYAGKIALEEDAEPTDIAINFGIENLSLSGASKSYTLPFTGTPDELAIALNLGLDLPVGIYAGNVDVAVNVYPNVKMTFDNDKYVALDLSGLKAVATAVFTPDDAEAEVGEYVIAEYNLDPEYPEDIILNLQCLVAECGAMINDTMFRIPVDLQAKFDNMIAEQKAPKTEGEAQNAIEGNVVDHVVGKIVPTLFDEQGNFQIGALLGVVGQLGDIVDAISPILATDGLFSYELGEDEATASATLNLEVLMDALLNDSDIISGITGDWNSFNLWFHKKVMDDETLEVTHSYEYKEGMTLAQILAEGSVVDNIVAFINTAIYDANKAEDQTYEEYFASEGAVYEFDKYYIDMLLNSSFGLNVDLAEIYDNLTVSVNGYAKAGIGFGLDATVGQDSQNVGLSLGLEIIKNENVSKTLTWEGDKTGAAIINPMLSIVDENVTISNCTGNDGGLYLTRTLLKIAKQYVPFLGNYVKLDTYAGIQVPVEEEPGEEPTFLRPFVGEHTVEITEDGQKVYFFFVPASDGKFVIEDPTLGCGVWFEDGTYMSGVQNATGGEPVNFYVSSAEAGTYTFVIEWQDAE